ncbi:hypothetical protein FRC04_001608 [Tulasnella sp. 424]|nr:hypothetical protein FRC04_001608 [Tulasnella sp. 424]
MRLDIPVTTFAAPAGDEWEDFADSKQPMCMLCNDGSQFVTVECSDLTISAVLLQRRFIFHMLSDGIAVVSLEAMEFRGSKVIISFVFEQNFLLKLQNRLMELIIKCRNTALKILPAPERNRLGELSTVLTIEGIEIWAKTAVDDYFQANPTDTTNDALFAVFLLHLIVLPHISISDRSQKPVTLHPELESKLRYHVMPKLFDAFNQGLQKHGAERRPDVDGRIFLNLVAIFTNQPIPDEDLAGLLGHGPADAAKSVAAALHQHVGTGRLSFSPAVLSSALGRWQHDELDSLPLPDKEVPLRLLLPFHNEVFDECLKPIHFSLEVARSETTPSSSPSRSSVVDDSEDLSQRTGWFTNTTTFTDDQHWHNSRKITEGFKEKKLVLYGERQDDDRPLTRKQLASLRKKKEKDQQKLMRNIHRHATTLTGAKGAPLQRMVIPTSKRSIKDLGTQNEPPCQRHSDLSPPVANPRPRKEPKSQQPKLNSTEKLRQRIKEEKAVKTLSESEVWWKQQLAQIERLPTPEQKSEYLGRVQRNAKRMEDSWLRTETLLYQVHLDVSRWIADGGREEPQVQARYCVDILRTVTEIHNIGVASDIGQSFVRSLLETIGFPGLDIFKLSSSIKPPETAKKAITFQTVRFAHRDRSKPALYPFLTLPSHPIEFQLEHYGVYMDRSMDGQADARVSFVPDAWQRDVLDRLDKRESVLVVAPTSAGKTFISYYAMEQVLRESDDGVLVYVAPTKPLVNQIVAEIYARYEKSLKSGTVWAAHTRDWRIHEPNKCQILVTVPEMLAIMLLSPVLAARWIPRLRWIVLDEIHTIGQQEGGAVWEQLILFAPCPIIGLSATIGNPEEFSRWLESVQEQHGFKYALIQHKHRYSHLRKFTYTMSRDRIEFKGLSSEPSPNVKPIYIHPMSVLLSGARVLPEDLALESRDCLTLFQAMWNVTNQSPKKRDQLTKLDPRKFFTQSHERLLSQRDVLDYEAKLKSLLADWSKEADAYHQILRPIGEALSQEHELCETTPTKRSIYMNLIHVLHDLQRRDNLPAILFNFDRQDCVFMARFLVNELETAEKKWKESSPQWQSKLASWEAWVAASKQRQKASERAKRTKRQEDDISMDSRSWEETFNPEDPLPEFSFAGPRASYSKAEMEEDIDFLIRSGIKEWAIAALKVGIAVHHAGMNRKYLRLIESLFRLGFVRVVIATGTLALGINMPIKTSIFVGDSVYLTALMYRQCAGRAGRRGMDILGNVVFYGIPMERIHGIITSKVPPLTGNMPLTTTLSLRLCNLLHGSQQASSAVNAINSVLRLPQLSLASDIGRDEVLHHLRFSFDYLRRTNLLNVQGEPLIMFPLVAHLYHTEPSNLALVALLQGGVLHRICDSIDRNPIDTKRSLVAVLAHLFARRVFTRLYSGGEHNDQILETFRGYARSYATQYLSETPDNTLPLSEEILLASKNVEASFISTLRRKAVKVGATSSFVANSGVTDSSLKTVTDLARTARTGLHLDKNAIPSLDELLALDGRVVNGYILDFFIHGQVEKVITEANRIRPSDIWFLFEEFSLALATLQTGLEHYMKAAAADPSLESESSDEEEDDADESENEGETEDLEPGVTSTFLVKPVGISEGDWKVYRGVVLTKREFDEKWKAMWA